MIAEEGTKVETDTSRSLSSTSFDAAFADDETDTPEPTETPVAETVEAQEPEADAGTVAPDPAVSDSPTLTLPEGYKLDSLGRVHGPDGRILNKEEAEAIKAQGVPGPVVEVAPPVAPPKVEEAPKVEAVAEPFRFRVNGERFEIPGLVVPPEQSERVRQLLIQGVNHERNFPRVQAEYKQKLAVETQRAEAMKAKYNKPAVHLLDRMDAAPDWFFSRIQNADLREALVSEWQREMGYLTKEIGFMLREADMNTPKAPAQPEAATVDPQQEELAYRGLLRGYVDELLTDSPDAKLFTEQDRKDFHEAAQQMAAAYFVEHEGETVLDERRVEAHFRRELALLQRAHAARDEAARESQKIKAAAAFNSAANTPVQPPSQPRPKPALVAAPSGTAKTKDQLFNEAWNNDDDE